MMKQLKMKQLKTLPDSARSGASRAYHTAMNHPKTATAVVLGTGVAAALLWAVRRNGTFSSTRKKVLNRVRGASKRLDLQ